MAIPHAGYMPGHPGAYHAGANKMAVFPSYGLVPMWQYMPPTARDTSRDHELRPPAAQLFFKCLLFYHLAFFVALPTCIYSCCFSRPDFEIQLLANTCSIGEVCSLVALIFEIQSFESTVSMMQVYIKQLSCLFSQKLFSGIFANFLLTCQKQRCLKAIELTGRHVKLSAKNYE